MKNFLRQQAQSFGHAFRGLRTLVFTERNIALHLIATCIVVAMGWWHNLSTSRWCLIVFAIALVWVAEAINTGVERLCDLVTKAYHPIIKQVKDICSAAVLIASLAAAIIGTLVFFC